MSAPAPTVSVVIPVHNAMPYLLKTVNSVLEQTIGKDRLEVIAIDDGSTDGSGEALDEFAAAEPGIVRVVHQEASGGPSAPRNRGMDLARGEFVFFLDADDYFGPEALERLVKAANENDSDVVLGKGVGEGGRVPPMSMFKANQPRADLYSSRVYWTLAPWKLYRRSLIERHQLRFPTGVRIGEDQPFGFWAYFHASNISVVADYDCVHVIRREDGGNITSGAGLDPRRWEHSDTRTLTTMVDLVGKNVPAGPKQDHLMHRHWEVEGVGVLNRVMRIPTAEVRDEQVALTRALLDRWYTPETARRLRPDLRLSYHLVQHGTTDEVLQSRKQKDNISLAGRGDRVYAVLPGSEATAGIAPGPWVDITDAVSLKHWLDGVAVDGTVLRVSGTGRLSRVPAERLGLRLALRRRGTKEVREFPLEHEDGVFTAVIDVARDLGEPKAAAGVWDFEIVASIDEFERRAKFGSSLGKPMQARGRLVHTLREHGRLRAPAVAKQYFTEGAKRLAVRVYGPPSLRRTLGAMKRRILG
ncbi:glycosyltransferase family 2 protein [Glycomyces algeriensis]|uniref:Glycosyl transferase family 2 n=1 Tax=Glycomyces algeriensis TaxID=256037 RepID=A0A9W6G7F7_9ACTN|nr:glycosyltransferase family 2 protein [Glycomyces algeriensis]MDA1366218.1 glycosyltransferase family 2 protein [Glycomyces algeriensis]MDR7349014.1 hypothetical protein [Glycomyces algeriensis]GLI41717.1 hypothetical protein GALLR39Z86_15670 [Glycomyces algeriensis]